MSFSTDRAASDRATATFAPEQFGRHRYQTPEGFVLWEGVRLARVGPMLYRPDEMPDVEPGSNGMVLIERDADVLFEPDAVLSFAGKPITNDHPPCPVSTDNFKQYAVGVVMNPRRGEGVEADYLLGDLLVTDADAIADIDAGKREVSAGYDVEVEEIKPGLGRQMKIVGNHVALVKRGRAGPSCSIQDEEPKMAKRTRTIFDRLRTAIRAKDEEAIEAELNEAEKAYDDETGSDDPQRVVIEIKSPDAPVATEADDEDESNGNDDIAEIKAAVAALTAAVQKLQEGKTETADDDGDGDGDDDDTTATDEDGDQSEEVERKVAMDALAKAEILAPGIKLPVSDAARSVKRSAITALRRQALKKAFASDHKASVEAVLGGRKPNFDTMKPGVVAVVFDAAAALVRAANNDGARPRERAFDVPQGRMTAARMQERILERRKSAR